MPHDEEGCPSCSSVPPFPVLAAPGPFPRVLQSRPPAPPLCPNSCHPALTPRGEAHLLSGWGPRDRPSAAPAGGFHFKKVNFLILRGGTPVGWVQDWRGALQLSLPFARALGRFSPSQGYTSLLQLYGHVSEGGRVCTSRKSRTAAAVTAISRTKRHSAYDLLHSLCPSEKSSPPSSPAGRAACGDIRRPPLARPACGCATCWRFCWRHCRRAGACASGRRRGRRAGAGPR